MVRKRVAIVHTGGTIGMAPTAEGYAPSPGHLDRLLARMAELSDPALPESVTEETAPLLDSADVTPAHWRQVADHLAQRYDQYDGFVVLHGTDTLAYTASALSFILEGLGKPVVMTGSQIPLCEVRNDARDNVIDALMVAGHPDVVVPEVCVVFSGRVLRGNRTVKVSADGLDAFASPNYPALGSGGVHLRIHRSRLLPPQAGGLRTTPLEAARVACVRLFPGMAADLLAAFLSSGVQGVVLEAFGAGNAPSDPALLRVLEDAVRRGVVVVVCSQCLEGAVDLSAYAAGSALARAGATSGFDMTPEAAMTKLSWLLGRGLSPDAVRERMQHDLRGELTRPAGP